MSPPYNSRPQFSQASKIGESHHMSISQGSFCTFFKILFQWPTPAPFVPPSPRLTMGCPYRPHWLHVKKPAGHGAPRLAQRKRTRPLHRPPHVSGWLRCAPAVQSRVVLRPQHTAAECADGWCCEHHCHRAPPRGRLRRARQPHLRQGTGGTAARARNAPSLL